MGPRVRLLVAAAALLAPAAAQAETAQAFLERTYAGYAREDFDPLDHLHRYFAAPLAAAIREDERLATGEVGYLDGDPLCDCQDISGLKPRVESVRMTGKRAASARVMLDFGTADQRTVVLQLVLTKHGWRVADVATRDQPSLLAALRRSNAKR
jgi:hypothetical protein